MEEDWIMYVATALMVFWTYMMAFLTFDDFGSSPSKVTSYVTAAIIVVALIL